MSYTPWKNFVLALILGLVLTASALAQQPRPGGPPAPPPGGPPPAVTPGGAEQPPMPPRMEGMRQRRHEMMERMHGMRGQGDRQDADDEDDDDDMSPRRGMRGHRGMFPRLVQELDLTEEQRAKARTLWHTHRKQAIRLRADVATARVDLHELLETDPVNLPKAKEFIQAIAAKRAEMHYGHVALMQDVRALLTPEQQKKFRALMGKMAMHGMHGMHGHD